MAEHSLDVSMIAANQQLLKCVLGAMRTHRRYQKCVLGAMKTHRRYQKCVLGAMKTQMRYQKCVLGADTPTDNTYNISQLHSVQHHSSES